MTKPSKKRAKKKSDVEVETLAEAVVESAPIAAPATNKVGPAKKANVRSPHYLFDVIECLKQRVALLEEKLESLEKKN